ncbi:hypothetical protein VF04_08660 [Nostoc linckia z7]|uniref:Uncharacterized protein n=2 Tax=Nostoc linckia TaxID=92942 RepID=A0A9Q5ZE47_NOSLI|nr:hypothetical protein VF02_19550 [Nostoc linckia z1]PHJ65856.1 hypothetical protein VF05_20395 [Nostoc linckia z3]PHJ72140.1 hypothetical protein VF03_19075 [Nostoc linckia z2]PHJ86575.1 hypothetical protein VF06_03575 [Nostoc linckia z4]PHJ86647.1 hypothetical protein VF07_21870 [Nostoc linckia z6]PHJ98761.1 hypothetical protein VF04_08660 [Nostoc linckia z7]PHK05015.1 hypothetical protein VF08_09375 [Nostoc linckia z8]PHK11291.1 hypothetical protein VF09_08085 [Nostoc linckia z9]PHK2418
MNPFDYVGLVMRKGLVTRLSGSLRKRGDAITISCIYYPSVRIMMLGLKYLLYGSMDAVIAVNYLLVKWGTFKSLYLCLHS